MKKIQYLAMLMLALFSLTFTSCKDDDNEDISPRRAMLTAGEWQAESIYVGPFDLTPFLAAEGIDITTGSITFNNDGTGTINILGQQSSGKWEFADNENAIVLDKGTADETKVEINRLTESELRLEVNVSDLGLEFEEDENVPPIETVELRFSR